MTPSHIEQAGAALPDLMTEREAAARLRLCPRTLRKARARGELHFVKYGRKILYSDSDLADFIERHRQCPSRNAKAPRSGNTRSRSTVFDFEEARAARRNVKLS